MRPAYALLVLDRDGNGTIDNGAELFGNATPQSAPPAGSESCGRFCGTAVEIAGLDF
jgi:hypothetical protein